MGTVFVHETAFRLDTSPFWKALTQAAQHDSQHMLVVTPSAEHKPDVYHHLKHVSGLLPRVLSLDELIFEAEGKNSQDSRALFLVLLETLLQNVPHRSASEKTSGFTACLLDLHYTLFHYNIDLDTYVRAHPPHLRDRASRYADFLQEFRDTLSHTFPLNRYSVYRSIQERRFDTIQDFCADKHLYFYGFLSVEPYQKPLLEHLFSYSQSTSMLLPYHEHFSCFELTKPTKDWLMSLTSSEVHCIPSSAPQLPKTLTVYEADTHEAECISLASLVSERHTTAPCSIAQLSSTPSFSGVFRDFQIPFSESQTAQLHPFIGFVLSLLKLLHQGVSSDSLVSLFSSPYAQTWHSEGTTYSLSPLPIIAFSHRLTASSFDTYLGQLHSVAPALEELEIPIKALPFLNGLEGAFSAIQLVLNSETPAQWQHHFKALLKGFIPTPSNYLDESHFVMASFEHELEAFVFTHADSFGFSSGRDFSGLVGQLFQEWHPEGLHDATASTHFTSLESLQWRSHHTRFVPQCTDALLPQNSTDNPLFPDSAQSFCHVSVSGLSARKQWFAFCQLVVDDNVVFSTPKFHRKTPGFASHFFDLVSSEFECDLHYVPLGRGKITSNTENQIASPTKTFVQHDCEITADAPTYASMVQSLTYSASQLDAYQTCPYRYFLKYILKLQPFETTQGDVAAHEWGALVHAIFQEYNLEKRRFSSPHHSLEKLSMIARKHFDEARQDTLQWDVKEALLFGSDETDGLLKAYIEIENQQEYSSTPLAVEQLFSLTDPLPLKGIIDAVFGINDGKSAYVLDYKTGKGLPSPTDVRLYRNLQLSVYMLACKTLFPEYDVVGASIFQLNSEKHVGKTIVCSTEDAKKDLFKLGRKRPFIFDDTFYSGLKIHLKALSTAIQKGLFSASDYAHLGHMTSRNSVCFTCDYKHQCHYKGRLTR
jgi:hypothetical protein